MRHVAGTVVNIETYVSVGLTVILEHAYFDDSVILIDGFDSTTKWYTHYLHLNDTFEGLTEGQDVQAGELIAYLGESGSTVTPHLHHEVRVGTRCSLEYALENPSSRCNTLGYDPHVHPKLV